MQLDNYENLSRDAIAWICPYCDRINKIALDNCKSCNAPRTLRASIMYKDAKERKRPELSPVKEMSVPVESEGRDSTPADCYNQPKYITFDGLIISFIDFLLSNTVTSSAIILVSSVLLFYMIIKYF